MNEFSDSLYRRGGAREGRLEFHALAAGAPRQLGRAHTRGAPGRPSCTQSGAPRPSTRAWGASWAFPPEQAERTATTLHLHPRADGGDPACLAHAGGEREHVIYSTRWT